MATKNIMIEVSAAREHSLQAVFSEDWHLPEDMMLSFLRYTEWLREVEVLLHMCVTVKM